MMRLIWFCCALLLLAGCQREPAPGGTAAGTATHPWELPNWQAPPELSNKLQSQAEAYQPDQQVETPHLRGPVLPENDTLDPRYVAGSWLQVCYVKAEKLGLVPPGEMNVLDLQPDGKGTYLAFHDYKAVRHEGTWSKGKPGIVELTFGQKGVTQDMYGQLFENDFLYLWSYKTQEGLWLVRAQPDMGTTIAANHFDTTRGDLRLTNVVAQSYQGKLSAEHDITVAGYFEMGVLTMRWEDERGNLGGYAAFIVSPDWQTLRGVWWIDDYQTAPFGGEWNGTRVGGDTSQ